MLLKAGNNFAIAFFAGFYLFQNVEFRSELIARSLLRRTSMHKMVNLSGQVILKIFDGTSTLPLLLYSILTVISKEQDYEIRIFSW